jgi:hypothetical protein
MKNDGEKSTTTHFSNSLLGGKNSGQRAFSLRSTRAQRLGKRAKATPKRNNKGAESTQKSAAVCTQGVGGGGAGAGAKALVAPAVVCKGGETPPSRRDVFPGAGWLQVRALSL